MHSFEVLGAPTRPNHLSWGPLEQDGAQSNSKRGPFGGNLSLGSLYSRDPRTHWTDAPIKKILAMSMVPLVKLL